MNYYKAIFTKKNSVKYRIFKIVSITFLVFFFIFAIIISSLLIFSPISRDDLYKPQSTLVFSSEGKILRAFVSEDDMWRLWTPLDKISTDLRAFVLRYEDQYFYYHPGINPASLLRAVIQNLKSGRVISGGSTITMQIARMIDQKPRTLKNKVIEVFRAFQLELTFSKDEILEIYLNMAPYGGNIEGVEAASWLYFNKSSRELSYGEAALLAALPNNPENIRPDRNHELAITYRDKVLTRMYENKILSYESYLQALEEEVPDERIIWPIKAPHLARFLHLNNEKNKILSTISLDIQEKAEKFLKRHVASLEDMGISNGAVVIIDNSTHQLVSMVGSADFFSEKNEGQVNGTLASRSPGSTLKPFLYALAIDKGIISPATYLEDVPIDYSGYKPENYDRKYNGLVSAREALEQSLNVPAVNLSDQMTSGHEFYDFLRDMELSTIRNENDYGLSLVLGGCEVTLLELTELYSIFANRGYFIETQILADTPKLLERKVFNSGTAFIISEILSEITRPDLPRVWEFTDLPKIAWKTGTSYGHKDAWSIGYNKQYTIGVWIGNFNAKSTPYIIGSYAAAPLLFDLFNEISRPNEIDWYSKPYIVNKRMVCSVSGQIPGENCSSQIEEYYLENISPVTECELHRKIYIDKDTGFCLPTGNTENALEKVYIEWPVGVATWRIKNNHPVYRVPDMVVNYDIQLAGKAPIINSPSSGVEYYIREGVSLDHQKISFSASVSSEVKEIYWFVDGKFLGSVKPGENFFYYPRRGKHRVVCQDDKGRSSEIIIKIN